MIFKGLRVIDCSSIPMRRLGKPEELNGLFLLFATDAGSWMTGACVPVDGGHLCSSL